jgi:hypothetical protein
MRKESLPRGIHRRNGSLVISFAYQGKVKYLSLGDCTPEHAKDQRSIIRMEIRKGTWQPKPVASKAPEPAPGSGTDCLCQGPLRTLREPYIRHYRNDGGKDEGRQTISWNYLKPMLQTCPSKM